MEQALERGGRNPPARMRAKALFALAVCVYGSGDDERLMALSEEGAALFRQVGDGHGEAHALTMSGFAALQLGDLDRASQTFEESLEGFREHEDDWGSAQLLTHLSTVALRRGDHLQAAELAEEALALTRRTGDRLTANVSLSVLAQAAWASDEDGRATRYWREALTVASELADKVNSAYCMRGLAAVAASIGEQRRAARLLGAAEALLEDTGLVLYAHARDELHLRAASAAREKLGEREWAVARNEGRTMTTEQAAEYALESAEGSTAL